MSDALKAQAVSILDAGLDATVATLRPDGWPQATTVSYASRGVHLYFGCGASSQKAQNLARDDRVSLTVTLPYEHWAEIRGVSLAGRARRLADPDELAEAGKLFLAKFGGELQQAFDPAIGEMAMFEVEPTVISVLDYAKGFGHTELLFMQELAPV